jgi:hypothetical protein
MYSVVLFKKLQMQMCFFPEYIVLFVNIYMQYLKAYV